MPGLYVDCKKCGKPFPSRIGVNEDAIHGLSMSGVLHRCPACRTEEEYFTADYYVPSETRATAKGERPPPLESHVTPAELAAQKLSGYGVGT